MRRILSDHDVQGQVSRLMDMCRRPPWVGLWGELEYVLCTFEDFDLADDATDAMIWQTCQDYNMLMSTGNRNAEGPESLEMTIRQRNTPHCLPVLTLPDPGCIQCDRQRGLPILHFQGKVWLRRGHGRIGVGEMQRRIAEVELRHERLESWPAIEKRGPGYLLVPRPGGFPVGDLYVDVMHHSDTNHQRLSSVSA